MRLSIFFCITFGCLGCGNSTPIDLANFEAKLKSKDKIERINTLNTLRVLGNSNLITIDQKKDVVKVLIKQLNSVHPDVRNGAAEALGAYSEYAQDAIPHLSKLLTDKYSGVRGNSANALGAIGPAAATSLSGIYKLSWDNDAGVRSAALQAGFLIDTDSIFTLMSFSNELKYADIETINITSRFWNHFINGSRKSWKQLLNNIDEEKENCQFMAWVIGDSQLIAKENLEGIEILQKKLKSSNRILAISCAYALAKNNINTKNNHVFILMFALSNNLHVRSYAGLTFINLKNNNIKRE